MRTVLAISDSVENTQFDLSRSIATVKALDFDPLSVVPTFYRADGSSEEFDVNEIIDYVFDECDTACVRIGYLTRPSVLSYLCKKLAKAAKAEVVVEPSLISDEGDILVSEDIYSIVCEELIGMSKLLVINSFEAELLAEFECSNVKDFATASQKVSKEYGCSVMIKSSERTGNLAVIFDGTDTACFEEPEPVNGFDTNKYDLVTVLACAYAQGKDTFEAANYGLEFVAGMMEQDVEVVSEPEVIEEKVVAVEPPIVKQEAKVEFAERNLSFNKTAVPSFNFSSFSSNSDENRSLVSPAKTLREISRGFDYPSLKDPETEPLNTAVTSTIEKPAPGPLGAVSDISTPTARLKYNVSELESLRDRLKNIAGSEK